MEGWSTERITAFESVGIELHYPFSLDDVPVTSGEEEEHQKLNRPRSVEAIQQRRCLLTSAKSPLLKNYTQRQSFSMGLFSSRFGLCSIQRDIPPVIKTYP